MAKVKKASSKVIELVQVINPKASKLTTFEEAWVIIAEKFDLEGGIEKFCENSKPGPITRFTIYYKVKGESTILNTLEWGNDIAFDEREMDWNWSLIYKDVLEWLIKNRITTKDAAIKGRAIKIKKGKEFVATKNSKANVGNAVEDKVEVKPKEVNPQDLKKEKDKIYHAIYNAKKAGKDYTDLQAKYDEIVEKMKNTQKPAVKSAKPEQISKNSPKPTISVRDNKSQKIGGKKRRVVTDASAILKALNG